MADQVISSACLPYWRAGAEGKPQISSSLYSWPESASSKQPEKIGWHPDMWSIATRTKFSKDWLWKNEIRGLLIALRHLKGSTMYEARLVKHPRYVIGDWKFWQQIRTWQQRSHVPKLFQPQVGVMLASSVRWCRKSALT